MTEPSPERAGYSRFTLAKPIAAINFSVSQTGETRTGLIRQLPKNATVELFGGGFNERTVAVRWRDSLYFVFLQDIESPDTTDEA
jgi:hypothetical protein